MKNANKLSIRELNSVLESLVNNTEIPQFENISEIDIVFFAGIFLWYKQHEENWKKIPPFINLSENEKGWKFSLYFNMIAELYNIKHNQIFEGIPVIYKKNDSPYSNYFAPPIYITEKNIECFFGDKYDNKINQVKNNYLDRFDITDFVFVNRKNFKNSKDKYEEFENEIKNSLKNCSPIFAFIFIIASKNLAKKTDETIENRKYYIDKLWLFSQDYVRGLYELAKNIVEHSGVLGKKGEGIITIRAYENSLSNKNRTLETHVIDYGKKGIIPNLIEYTNDKSKKSRPFNKRIQNCYIEDREFFLQNKNYELKDFIAPKKGKELKQQTFRHTSHYGINKLYRLIKTTLKGEMYAASEGYYKRNYYGESAADLTITFGTHFYYKIPFIANNFKNIEAIPFSIENQTSTLGETASIEFLSKVSVVHVKLNQLSEINLSIQHSLIDISIEDKLTKQNIESVYDTLDWLLKINENNKIAINLQNQNCDVSVLLRFLSYLTFEYKQPFIIYNVIYDIYYDLLIDNKNFHESRRSEAYWHGERAILLFVKSPLDFYFADILFGKEREDFLLVNNILNKTFPNTITLLQEIEDKKKGTRTDYIKTISSNQNLRHFFYPKSNILLPFDTLLKNTTEDKTIFVTNLATILQNPLFDRLPKYENLNQYILHCDGFRIKNTHFKIGTKIHSEDFYYAKRLFQNSFYTARLAMLLSIDIVERISDTNKEIMLVGYEMYSELILSLIERFIKDFFSNKANEKIKINHFVTQSDDKYKFLPNDTFIKYINNYYSYTTIIIVPIAATGNTANKIENDIREQIYLFEKKKNKVRSNSDEIARSLSYNYNFFDTFYNILLAQPEKGFETIKKNSVNQRTIIKLPATWFNIKDCPLCYGKDDGEKKTVTKTLFETDKSSLTPSLIFGKPIGKTKANVGCEIESNFTFNDLHFEESLKYKSVFRNNNYRIYYIDSDKFIQENIGKIKDWLKKIVKVNLGLKTSDKVVIVSPCHETNSRFLNLVNEYVFSSSATIIHHQSNIDFAENFKLLNRSYLTNETKLFYVDDSLISGKHYYEIFDLVKDVTVELNNNIVDYSPFVASIFLKDKSEPFVHNKIVESSKMFFSFANVNQPPALNSLEQRPLEHERQRYESLSKTALHDVTIGSFQKKANELNPLRLNNTKIKVEKDKEKEKRRLKNFEATHKIFEYFALNKDVDKYTISEIVSFKDDENNPSLFPDLPNPDNQKSLLKVLSQYPFILYQPLREKTFEWFNMWLLDIEKPNEKKFEYPKDYHNFQTIKFLLRRATLLGNYKVIENEFLIKILTWFIKIDKHIDYNNQIFKQKRNLAPWQENLQDFPIYVLRNYIEMIQKNGWVAFHLFKNIKESKLFSEFNKSKQGMQFLRMLQIESGIAINDFYEMLIRERGYEWRYLFKNYDTFIEQTNDIVDFFQNDLNQYLLESNKFLIVKETFLNNSNEWIRSDSQFINFLWIKQLLLVDCIDKNSYFPKNVDYQRKINVIIDKMKGFFHFKNGINVFFIVTDGQQTPHILKEENNLLTNFNEEYEIDKKNRSSEKQKDNLKLKTQILINFLNGINSNTGIAHETTAEFFRNHSEEEVQKNKSNQDLKIDNYDLFSETIKDSWTDVYNSGIVELTFMPKNTKWLYLVRITKHNEEINKFDTLGLLGFYSTENLHNTTESLLTKQLLMLLRRDMGKFIEKHHKNDEFAGLIQQKEKADYQFLMRHGVSDYTNAINNNLTKTTNEYKEEYLKILFEYLVNKFNIISKLSTQTKEYENITTQKIISEFNKYNFIFSFYSSGISTYSIEDVNKFVEFNTEFDNDVDIEYIFPKNYLCDLAFELLYNIRKHIIVPNKEDITETKKLKISVCIKNEILYVENNHCTAEAMAYKEKSHGLNLVEKIWRSYDLGLILYGRNENDTFTVKIPLKKFI